MIENEKRRKEMSKEYKDRKIESININELIKASSENMLPELALACQEQSEQDIRKCKNREKDQSK
jgi:hypothetical protein